MPGGRGVTKAKVHAEFKDQAEALQEEADLIAKSVRAEGQRPWQTGAEGTDWPGDPLDIPGIADAFNRDEIGGNYAECLSDPTSPGTTGDAQALTLQSDWLAMQERAFRVRHETSVRSAIHAAARRRGHAHEKGVVAVGVVKYVEDLIKRGA